MLHDPVWYDHLPYIPFPAHWPVFTPKDKMGDWLEMYVKVMELSYWGGTECVSASFDERAMRWTVELMRDGKPVILRPAQLVFATGAYGPPKLIDLPGAADFKGEILHSSQYADSSRYKGKKAVVIGAASSGHDVAVDLWEAGADVTMVQRSATTVVRSETLMELAFDIYSEQAAGNGIDVDKADLIAAAIPFALQPPRQKALYDKIRARDADFYRKLEATGFLLDFGPDETGLMMKAYRTGSGYYVDVGASQLIIDGEIKDQGRRGDRDAYARRHPLRRRRRDRGRRDHPIDRLPVDARGDREDRLARGRRRDRHLLGPGLGHAPRPRSVARRIAQHVQAVGAEESVASGRQPGALPLLLEVRGAADQGAHGGHRYAGLQHAAAIDAIELTRYALSSATLRRRSSI